jgi:hypothetical protein
MREMKKPYTMMVEKSEKKRPIGRYKCRWENNIKSLK